jgi:thioredoxin-related protein
MEKTWIYSGILLAFALQSCQAQTSAPAETLKKEALVWHTDLAKAEQLSAQTKKPIFAFFTGSDWCGWCKKLQNDVFAKPEFVKWASEKVVLLELDFPRRKTLPTELAQQNNELQRVFGIQGYPTIWMFHLNDKGNNQKEIAALGSLGYPTGATQGQEQVKFLEDASKILKN